jgi:hypothetical protein
MEGVKIHRRMGGRMEGRKHVLKINHRNTLEQEDTRAETYSSRNILEQEDTRAERADNKILTKVCCNIMQYHRNTLKQNGLISSPLQHHKNTYMKNGLI